MVSSVSKIGLTPEQAEFVNYSVSYIDGTDFVEKTMLPINMKDTIMVKIKYKDYTGSVPSTNLVLNLSLQLTYVQADETGFSKYDTFEKLLSKRAVSDNIKSEFVSSSSGIDFSKVGSNTNGKGIYTRAGTETDLHPIYYYRGDTAINHVKFAGFCWRIVRTTETGGVKLIYNGIPGSEGSCNNTGEATGIGKSVFSEQTKPSVGYMYGKSYPFQKIDLKEWEVSAIIAKGSNYSSGLYELSDFYRGSVNYLLARASKGEYFCFEFRYDGPFCDIVYYITFIDLASYSFRSVPLEYGETIDRVFGDITTKSANTTNSAIKIVTDTWYQKNMIPYTSKLEDTVWCNDRSTSSTISDDLIGFSDYTSILPKVLCPNSNDKFTVDSRNGNGKLTYPVGILTADEFLMGNNYLKVGADWWTMTPSYYDNQYGYSYVNYVDDGGLTNVHPTHDNLSVRPSISLKPGTIPISGSGSAANPYIVE